MIQEAMITKEMILSLLDQKLTDLSYYYEQKIITLNEEKKKLEQEVCQQKIEMEDLLTELNKFKSMQEQKVLLQEMAEQMILQQSIKGLSEKLFHSLQKANYSECEKIFDEIISFDDSSLKSNESELVATFERIFFYQPNDITEMEPLYIKCFSLIKCFQSSHAFKLFLSKNQEIINERIVDLNEPSMISDLAGIYFYFNLNDALGRYLNTILSQWEFIDANIEKRDFILLLWYCLYLGLDEKLLKRAKLVSAFLNDKGQPDTELYLLYQNIKNGRVKFEKIKEKLEEMKLKAKYLKDEDKSKLFRSFDNRVNKCGLNKQKAKSIVKTNKEIIPSSNGLRKVGYVFKLPHNINFLPESNKQLQEEWIRLIVYKDPFLKEECGYVTIKGLSENKAGKIYVTGDYIKEIKVRIGKKWVYIRDYKQANIVQKNPLNKTDFNWPSTDLKGGYTITEENHSFNEESELKKVGYQITGQTREKRWKNLEIAVKKLGLQKVAVTIAQNVKLRKGQTNGEKKFSYAIGEWEYDLAKLKQVYFRNTFPWPSTKVNK